MYFYSNRVDYFWILFFIKSIILIYIFPYVSLFMLSFSIFYLIKNNINTKTVIIGVCLSILIYLSLFYNSNTNIYFGEVIDSILHFSIRDYILNHIQNTKNIEASSLILLTGFGEKNELGLMMYKDFINLSISHLIVVSGYHLSFVSKLIQKIFKNEKIKWVIIIIILVIVNYNLNFNFGIFRSSLFLILMAINKGKQNSFMMLSLSGVIILFFCPLAIINYSFLMSYISTFVIIFLSSFLKKGLLSLFIMVFINFSLSPLISQFSNFISITGILFSFVYSNIFCILFLFSTFFFGVPYIDPIFTFIYFILNWLISIFGVFNFKIHIPKIDIYFLTMIYLFLFYFISKRFNNFL